MRHNKKFNHLGRTASHRNAMLANMACSLIKHKRITTTVAKAKALKKFVEPLITKAKDDTTNSRRVVFSNLQDKYAVTELFKEISVKIADRPGVTLVLSRLVTVWVTTLKCASLNSLTTTKTWLRKRLPRRLLVPAVQRKLLLLKLLLLQKLLHQLQKLLLLRKLKLNNSTILFIYRSRSNLFGAAFYFL